MRSSIRARLAAWMVPLVPFLLLAWGCGDDDSAPPGFSTGPGGPPEGGDGPSPGNGQGDGDMPEDPIRPPDGPMLPPADAELVVELDGDRAVHRIEVAADLGALDVHFSIDTSASIGAEIDQLQGDLEEVVIPLLQERVPDVSFGVSRFEDFPAPPFGLGDNSEGATPDTPFELLTPVTNDLERITQAVALLDRPLGFGGDNPESGAEALYQIATGEGYVSGRDEIIIPFDREEEPAAGGGLIGGAGFRDRALHVVIHVTDAPSHAPDDYGSAFPDTRSLEDAAEALNMIGARVIGIVSNLCPPDDGDPECEGSSSDTNYDLTRAQLEWIATATGARQDPDRGRCPFGIDGANVPAFEDEETREDHCPYVFDVAGNGEGLSETLVESVITLVDGVRFETVTAEVVDDPLGFVERIVPVLLEQDDGVEAPALADRLPEDEPDGDDESFVDVRAKARLGFDVHLRNRRIAALAGAQRYRVVVAVLGDELIISQPTLRLVIPAGEAPPPIPLDGGTGDPADGSAAP